MHVMPVLVDCTIQIGASGAVSSFAGTLVSSVVRLSAGKYKINLADPYANCNAVVASMQSASGGLSGIASIEVQNAPASSVSNFSAPSLTVTCLNTSGAATDPANGSAVCVLAMLNNSKVKS